MLVKSDRAVECSDGALLCTGGFERGGAVIGFQGFVCVSTGLLVIGHWVVVLGLGVVEV